MPPTCSRISSTFVLGFCLFFSCTKRSLTGAIWHVLSEEQVKMNRSSVALCSLDTGLLAYRIAERDVILIPTVPRTIGEESHVLLYLNQARFHRSQDSARLRSSQSSLNTNQDNPC
jgi:hypothetical protein